MMRLESRPGLVSGLITLLRAFCLPALGSLKSLSQAVDRSPAYDGKDLFGTYCASCHGASGKGDGPIAQHLQPRPSDVTRIARQNNGTFPQEKVMKIIDGRERIKPHGDTQMPVWRDAFSRSAKGADEESVKQRIQALLEYLESIQERPAKPPVH